MLELLLCRSALLLQIYLDLLLHYAGCTADPRSDGGSPWDLGNSAHPSAVPGALVLNCGQALPGAVDNMAATVSGFGGFGGGAPSGAQTAPPGGISPYTSYEQSSRFNGAITGPAGAATTQDLSKKDIRNTRDSTLRQITRLD